MAITYKNSASQITINQAIDLNKKGVSVIINDGKDITFESEDK